MRVIKVELEENEVNFTINDTDQIIVFESDHFDGVRAVSIERPDITGHGSKPSDAIRDLMQQIEAIDKRLGKAVEDITAVSEALGVMLGDTHTDTPDNTPENALRQPVASIMGGAALLYPPLQAGQIRRDYWAAVHCRMPIVGFGRNPNEAKENLLINQEQFRHIDKIRPISDLAALHDLIEGAVKGMFQVGAMGGEKFPMLYAAGMLSTLCWALGHGESENKIRETIETAIKPLAIMAGMKDNFVIFDEPYTLDRLNQQFHTKKDK